MGRLESMGRLEIARSLSACLKQVLSAGGAGLVTALTVLFKFSIIEASLTFIAGSFLSAVNFIGSFLLIQVFGFRLATKQSPLFGAALGRLRHVLLGEDFTDEVHWTFRTQLASAIGNLLFVIPAAFIVGQGYFWVMGDPVVEVETAQYAIQSLNPWKTGTLLYATGTGIMLWFCSFAGSLTAHQLGFHSKRAANVLFNVFLGILLAGIPMLGKALHLPLDVRHFTLSGGAFALATSTLGWKEAWNAGLGSALVGVLAIGVLNFSVSFAIAFFFSKRAEVEGLLPGVESKREISQSQITHPVAQKMKRGNSSQKRDKEAGVLI